MKEKIITIIDHIGRTLIGVESGRTDTTLTLKNPVILHVEMGQQGNISFHPFPLFFFELQDKDTRHLNNWTFTLANIVVSDIELSQTVQDMYGKINTPAVPVVNNPKVVSISDI
jgi:hypothetical protein